jgi:hypothetical protein
MHDETPDGPTLSCVGDTATRVAVCCDPRARSEHPWRATGYAPNPLTSSSGPRRPASLLCGTASSHATLERAAPVGPLRQSRAVEARVVPGVAHPVLGATFLENADVDQTKHRAWSTSGLGLRRRGWCRARAGPRGPACRPRSPHLLQAARLRSRARRAVGV